MFYHTHTQHTTYRGVTEGFLPVVMNNFWQHTCTHHHKRTKKKRREKDEGKNKINSHPSDQHKKQNQNKKEKEKKNFLGFNTPESFKANGWPTTEWLRS